MKIGDINIDGKLFLAPMCNVTSLPFRVLCKKEGAAMVYSEMVHADAYMMESNKSIKKIFFLPEERPIGVQLTGSDLNMLVKASIRVEHEMKPDLIDINIGCPGYNVMKTGSGAALLKDKEKVYTLVKKLSEKITIPLTCKIRILEDEDETLRIAELIEKAGAKAITIHGRTAKQKYSGKASWNIIKKIKAKLAMPIILNGDVIDEVSTKKAFDLTKCDAVMIGRAAIGNPFLFTRINHYLKTGQLLEKQSLKSRISDFMQFIDLCKKYNYMNIGYIKMLSVNFTRGFIGGRKIRSRITNCKSVDEIYMALNNWDF